MSKHHLGEFEEVVMLTVAILHDEAYGIVKDELKNMFWYDRKVFEIINEGESIADFSRNSYIEYYSLYNTYRKVKDKLKKLI